MPWCYAARNALVRLVARLPVGMGALSVSAPLSVRGTSVLCEADSSNRFSKTQPFHPHSRDRAFYRGQSSGRRAARSVTLGARPLADWRAARPEPDASASVHR